jgi:hypothetical protein
VVQGGCWDICINWREYILASLILSYAGALIAIQDAGYTHPYLPKVLLIGDNMMANKAAKSSL